MIAVLIGYRVRSVYAGNGGSEIVSSDALIRLVEWAVDLQLIGTSLIGIGVSLLVGGAEPWVLLLSILALATVGIWMAASHPASYGARFQWFMRSPLTYAGLVAIVMNVGLALNAASAANAAS